MNLRHLRAFETSARLGSLNLAAAETMMSQSSVSYAISAVESVFGRALLTRGPQGCSVNTEGAIVLARACNMFSRIERAVRSLAETKHEKSVGQISRSLSAQQISAVVALTQLQRPMAAARTMGLSETTLLRRIREVEALLGVTIFHRADNSFFVREVAAVFTNEIALSKKELDYAVTELALHSKTAETTIDIGCVGLARTALMPEVIGIFTSRFPRATVHLSHESFDRLFTRLMSGELDILIGTERDDIDPKTAECTFLFDNSYAVVCRRDHPLAGQSHVSAQDLLRYGWILPMGGAPLRAALCAEFEEWGQTPHVVLETPSTTTSWALMLNSDHIMVSSIEAIAACRQSDHIHVVPFGIEGNLGRVVMYSNAGMRLPELQRQFARIVRGCAEDIRGGNYLAAAQ